MSKLEDFFDNFKGIKFEQFPQDFHRVYREDDDQEIIVSEDDVIYLFTDSLGQCLAVLNAEED